MGYRDENIVGKVWGNILKRGVEKKRKKENKQIWLVESRLPIGLRNYSSEFTIMLYDPSYLTCNFKTSFVARGFVLVSEGISD